MQTMYNNPHKSIYAAIFMYTVILLDLSLNCSTQINAPKLSILWSLSHKKFKCDKKKTALLFCLLKLSVQVARKLRHSKMEII